MKMKLGKLSNIDIYYYIHNPQAWIETLFVNKAGKKYTAPKQSWERIAIAWITYFMMDDSGRSTAKTWDYMICAILKAILLQRRFVVFFSGDARRGNSKTREYVGRWIEEYPRFAETIVPIDNIRGAIVRNRGGTTELPFKNGSLFKSYTPDWNSLGENTQSDRCNELIFNEWTSYPQPSSMVENVEPIATGTNYYRSNTMNFRIFMEKILGTPLGNITNEQFMEIYEQRPGYIPREHITSKSQPTDKALSEFFRGFNEIFGFTYHAGIKDNEIQFPQIKNKEDIILFFENYLDGDPVYGNKIVYDGSAKRPSDECFLYKTEHTNRINGDDPRYNEFNISVDELGLEWDGIVYDSNIIAKARQGMLKEDYDRVYGGKWTEGTSHRPYSPEDIDRCRDKIKPICERGPQHNNSIFVMGADAAKGTEQMRRGKGNVNTAGKGDDACGVGILVGDGTQKNPHKVIYAFMARDVRAEPAAVQLHKAHKKIGFNLIAIDPNGGGGPLVDALGKGKIELDNKIYEYEPLIMHDYEGQKDGDRCLMYISRSEKIITEAHRLSESSSPFRGDDMLLDSMHTNLQNLIEKGGVVFPERADSRQILMLHEAGEITKEEVEVFLALEEMVQQLTRIQYKLDNKLPTTDKRVRTRNGVFQYSRSNKKDLAMSLIYGLYVANIWKRWDERRGETNANSFSVVYG